MYSEGQFDELRPLQKRHTEIIKYIAEFCDQNKIKWCLAYGSALGARRHGGPIPWDDDADLYMTVEDYNKFRNLFREKGNKTKFYLQEMYSIEGMVYAAKLRMNGTSFVEENLKRLDVHQGIFVDIFILHECPPNWWERNKAVIASLYITIKRLSIYNYNKRKIMVPLMWVLRRFPKKFGMKTAYKQLYKWDNVPQKRLADWELYVGNPKWFVDRDVILPPRKIKYEEYEFYVPNKVDKYLEIVYGDWNKIPSKKNIQWSQHAKNWSVSKDFHEILDNIHDYSDEKI